MKKFYVASKDYLNEQELKTGKVSYWRIIDRYIDNRILCNSIDGIDESIWENVRNYNDDDIYQYFLCNLNEFEREMLLDYGIILSYSEKLDLDVLLVDHLGTAWDYVMTDIDWTLNINE